MANWICSPSNGFFAKAFVNRLWSKYFGRGFVNPVDDMSDENQPSHPELLAALAREFGTSGFDIKHMIRGICNSRAYQRTSKPLGDNRDDHVLFSHQSIKVLTGEQLFDCLAEVIGSGGPRDGARRRAKAPKGGPVGPRDQFAAFFKGTENSKPTDYEAGIPQALRLMNSPQMAAGRLTNVAVRTGQISRATNPKKAIDKLYLLYLTALAHRRRDEENDRIRRQEREPAHRLRRRSVGVVEFLGVCIEPLTNRFKFQVSSFKLTGIGLPRT